MRRVCFFFHFISNCFLGYAACRFFSLHGDGFQHFVITLSLVVEYNLSSDGIGNGCQMNGIGVCIGNGIVMSVFLQHNDTVFVKIGAKSGFITKQVGTGNAIHGLLKILQFQIFVRVATQSLDCVSFCCRIGVCFNPNHTGTSIVKISRIFSPALFFCQCYGFDPRKVIAPSAGNPVYVMPFPADNLRPLGFGFNRILPILFYIAVSLAHFIRN